MRETIAPVAGRLATVLVVDDNEGFRDLAISYLEKAGYAAVGASSTVEARECLERQFVDLLVLDENLESGSPKCGVVS